MSPVPYKLLLTSLKAEGDFVTMPKDFFEALVRCFVEHSDFDEESYLRLNPDVAASIRQGLWADGKAHYVARGYFEGRDGAGKPFEEAWYLKTNPDVANAVKAGDWPSGEDHYNKRGFYEWRAPNKASQKVFSAWKDLLARENLPSQEAATVSESRV